MACIKLKLPIRRELPAARRAQVIDAALVIAGEIGAQGLTRDRVAAQAGVCSSLLHRYFGSMDRMREVVIQTAFDRGNTDVLYKSLSIDDFKRLNVNKALTEQLCKFLKS